MCFDVETLRVLAQLSVDDAAGWGMGYYWLNDTESSDPYYRFLHRVVRQWKLKLVVELGVYLGRATAHMALAHPNATIIGVDIQLRPEALEIKECHCSNIHYVEGNSLATRVVNDVKIFTHLYGPAQLLFIDTAHDGLTPAAEFELYRDMLADEALIVCDDIHANPAMDDFWDRLPGEKLDLSLLHPAKYPTYPWTGFGVSIWRRNESNT